VCVNITLSVFGHGAEARELKARRGIPLLSPR
jgi:hypothetical protein